LPAPPELLLENGRKSHYNRRRVTEPGKANSRMARKVIIDCDMSTDDAVALAMALFDPRLDVLAITACEGCVGYEQANSNLQAILNQLDPDRYPRVGLASPVEGAPAIGTSFLYGEDGLGNSDFPVSRLQHTHPSEKVIIDLVRAHPGEVTVVCLGPLSNLARAIQRDPMLPSLIHRLIVTGGCVEAPGNVTPAADFNFYFDPQSARKVIQSKATISLIPLDVTTKVSFGLDLMQDIPSVDSRVGHFLHQILPHTFRTYRQQLGREMITLNDAIGIMALIEPSLFRFEEMAGDVETHGELTRGATIFDRRVPSEWSHNMEVALEVDTAAVRQEIRNRLNEAGTLTRRGAE
jgi:inosine-uridine nucleoside N-ribohydrolase